eukprot:UN04786
MNKLILFVLAIIALYASTALATPVPHHHFKQICRKQEDAEACGHIKFCSWNDDAGVCVAKNRRPKLEQISAEANADKDCHPHPRKWEELDKSEILTGCSAYVITGKKNLDDEMEHKPFDRPTKYCPEGEYTAVDVAKHVIVEKSPETCFTVVNKKKVDGKMTFRKAEFCPTSDEQAAEIENNQLGWCLKVCTPKGWCFIQFCNK